MLPRGQAHRRTIGQMGERAERALASRRMMRLMEVQVRRRLACTSPETIETRNDALIQLTSGEGQSPASLKGPYVVKMRTSAAIIISELSFHPANLGMTRFVFRRPTISKTRVLCVFGLAEGQEMRNKIFYIVQAYEAGRRGIVRAGVPIEARTPEDAERIAKRLSIIRFGAVAFSRDADTDNKDLDKPTIIASFGQVPEGVF